MLTLVRQVAPEIVANVTVASLQQPAPPTTADFITATSAPPTAEGARFNPQQQQQQQQLFGESPYRPAAPMRAPDPPRSVYDTGRGDLDPFPAAGLIAPRPVGGMPPGQPGSGSLVGPNHPMFANPPQFAPPYAPDGSDYFFPGGSVGPGGDLLPHPRFDPFGPVVGPHSGVDVGNVGVRPPFGGGRGGRGGTGRLFPGEPNPDHLKPPGW